jgi:hypothetical protein
VKSGLQRNCRCFDTMLQMLRVFGNCRLGWSASSALLRYLAFMSLRISALTKMLLRAIPLTGVCAGMRKRVTVGVLVGAVLLAQGPGLARAQGLLPVAAPLASPSPASGDVVQSPELREWLKAYKRAPLVSLQHAHLSDAPRTAEAARAAHGSNHVNANEPQALSADQRQALREQIRASAGAAAKVPRAAQPAPERYP